MFSDLPKDTQLVRGGSRPVKIQSTWFSLLLGKKRWVWLETQ